MAQAIAISLDDPIDNVSSIPEELRNEIESVVPDVDDWLRRANDQLCQQRPIDLIGTSSEPSVRNLIRMIKAGMFS